MTESGAPRGWVEALAAALIEAGRDGRLEAEAFACRCPTSYFERTAPEAAAADVSELEALASAGPHQAGDPHPPYRMAIQPDPDVAAGMFRFRMYTNAGVELSSFLHVLESFGLIVVEAVPHRIAASAAGQPALHLDDFGLRVDGRADFDPSDPVQAERLVSAIEAAWAGLAEVDSLNRLVVHAGTDWRDVIVLRAYRRYRRQAGTAWTDRQLDDALVSFPDVTRALLGYFAARFDPEPPGGGAEATAAARLAVLTATAAVERLEHDQVLRGFLSLIDATVRTSHYLRDPSGRPWDTLTLKFDSVAVPELPPPRPYVETFVYSAHTEGLHLRGGPIARGGIRWSDRQDDLRTEILGLVRAQVLKNAGIVPTGAKGGFVCKRATGPDMASAVRTAYATFIRGLLDVTDNVVAGRVLPPASVRAADGDDPYLVVAADRGTAPLSDLANAISAEYGFWLGDAFASGGSHGYDHKAMGITARGVWVAVRQHFQELAIDVQREPIKVVGIGDMSGDVFGNGMLQSEAIKLVAAFDHRDVFVDPNPDPARAYAERRRLFELTGSSWQDYDRAALSPGGGVWARTTKAIELGPEAGAALGIAAGPDGGSVRTLSPPELVSAILTAPCDLLYIGGIGTFVKASAESHADAGDHANDRIRVDADRIRARVIAEGGNLGLTQRARIQFSRRGGRVNTDFIDNAAGVEISDREVNLKILLSLAIERGLLAASDRDPLLAAAQDEVAAGVLREVGLSTRAVARAVPASADDLEAFEALLTDLEGAGRLDRKVDALPDTEEFSMRRGAGAGLIRPELAVLHAAAKSELIDAIDACPVATDPDLAAAAVAYFPRQVTSRFAHLVADHQLRRQLVATAVGSEIVDRMGITWAHETADELDVDEAEVAAAYWAAREVSAADRRWRRVEAADGAWGADAENLVHGQVARLVDALARAYLRQGERPPAREDAAIFAELEEEAGAGVVAEVEALVKSGVDRETAVLVSPLSRLFRVAEVAAVARRTGWKATAVNAAFARLDAELGLTAFELRLSALVGQTEGRWERWQVRSLLDDTGDVRREAVARALTGATDDLDGAIGRFLAGREGRRSRFERLARQLDVRPGGEAISVATLAARALAGLLTP